MSSDNPPAAIAVAAKPPPFWKRWTKEGKVATNGGTGKEIPKDEESNPPEGEVNEDGEKVKPKEEIPSVSFFALFRFATRLEIFLNIIGIGCAVGAGAAQILVVVIFGNQTKTFTSFGTSIPSPDSLANLDPNIVQAAIDKFNTFTARYSLALLGMGLGVVLLVWFSMFIWTYSAEKNAKRIREAYLKAVLRQEIAYFDNVGAGEVTTRIQSDTDLVQRGMSEKVVLSVQWVTAFFTGIILAYVRSWRLALVITGSLLSTAVFGGLSAKFIMQWTKVSQNCVADSGTLAEETISTIRTTKAFGMQDKLAGMYDKHIDDGRRVDLKAALLQGWGFGVAIFVIYAADSLAFWYGATLVLQGRADIAVIFTVFMALLMGSFSIAVAAPHIQAVTQGIGAAGKLFATINRVSLIDSFSTDGLFPTDSDVKGEIKFENVSFEYPSRLGVPIFKELDITFEAGTTTAIVGPSGSGKSTVVALIERFYDPLGGAVCLDGRDIKELNIGWLRRKIGLVSQEPVLFSATIRDNVLFGLCGSPLEEVSPEKKEELVKEACIKANAHGFITKLTKGYDTLVGERGYLLSGGQKQRIAIARAIISDPKILLLDEATSALDTESEGIVQNALDKATAGRTTIVIAHRLSTIKKADVILVMANGQILERGTHDGLLNIEGGHYRNLVTAQSLRDDSGPTLKVRGGGGGGGADRSLGVTPRPSVELAASKERLSPSPSTKAAGEKQQQQIPTGFFRLFIRILKLNRDCLLLYLIGGIASIGAGAHYPSYGILYAQAIVNFQFDPNNEASRRTFRSKTNNTSMWLTIVAILAGIVNGVQQASLLSSATNLTSKLRKMTFKALLKHDVEYFDQDDHKTGAVTANLSGNPRKIEGIGGLALGAMIQGMFCLFAGIIVGFAFAPKIAAVALACIPLLMGSGYIAFQVVFLKDGSNKKAHEDSAAVACEAASAIRTVASLTKEQECCKTYSDSLIEPVRRSRKAAFVSMGFFALSQGTAYFTIALVSWYGSKVLISGEYTTRDYFACFMAAIIGAQQAGSMFAFIPDMSAATTAATDILKLLYYKPKIEGDQTGKTTNLTELRGHITIEDIYFNYPTRPDNPVLRGLSLAAAPGQHVALVGQSGCGKSTIVQLLERFYNPNSGSIYLDGQPIQDIHISEFRKQLALVSQEPTLYAGTIRFNILLGAIKPMEEVTQDEMETACREANILEFIRGLPEGFETQVGSKGTQLSGGQKQRIAIARALIRNPKVLLLDEATSALDTQSEKVVQEALDQAAKGRTTITIAHRLSTIQNADCIYYIQDGRVLESGNHQELMALRGAYHASIQLQQLSRGH